MALSAVEMLFGAVPSTPIPPVDWASPLTPLVGPVVARATPRTAIGVVPGFLTCSLAPVGAVPIPTSPLPEIHMRTMFFVLISNALALVVPRDCLRWTALPLSFQSPSVPANASSGRLAKNSAPSASGRPAIRRFLETCLSIEASGPIVGRLGQFMWVHSADLPNREAAEIMPFGAIFQCRAVRGSSSSSDRGRAAAVAAAPAGRGSSTRSPPRRAFSASCCRIIWRARVLGEAEPLGQVDAGLERVALRLALVRDAAQVPRLVREHGDRAGGLARGRLALEREPVEVEAAIGVR